VSQTPAGAGPGANHSSVLIGIGEVARRTGVGVSTLRA